jgi:glycosyltransferase involved in cell wall biosynthesis
MANMDVNTICYRIREGEWIRSGYPVKLNEYLAVGRPVVASEQDVITAEFGDVVRVARTPDDWALAIQEALDGRGIGTCETRQARARANDWNERATLFDRWLREIA